MRLQCCYVNCQHMARSSRVCVVFGRRIVRRSSETLSRLGDNGGDAAFICYAWAERAKQCGYPERFAQEALGHNSKAVHRAHARKAQVMLSLLKNYERKPGKGKVVKRQIA
jgi:hypothetical protein